MWVTLIILVAIIVVISLFSNSKEDEQIKSNINDSPEHGDEGSDYDFDDD